MQSPNAQSGSREGLEGKVWKTLAKGCRWWENKDMETDQMVPKEVQTQGLTPREAKEVLGLTPREAKEVLGQTPRDAKEVIGTMPRDAKEVLGAMPREAKEVQTQRWGSYAPTKTPTSQQHRKLEARSWKLEAKAIISNRATCV